MHAELDELAPALAAREWRFASNRRLGRSHAVLLFRGSGAARLTQGRLQLSSPSFAWMPSGSTEAIGLEAGSAGFVLSADEALIARALAGVRQPSEMRALFDRVIHLENASLEPRLLALRQSFAAIGTELRDNEEGAHDIVACHLAIVLRLAGRLSGDRVLGAAGRPSASLLFQRFVQAAELHFREHWTVARYALELGVTERRLHMACMRATGRSPLVLLHQRLVIEARARLEQSAVPVAQIGYGLGFADASQFSRFFRRLTGETAGAYRSARRGDASGETSFAAWP